MLHRLENLLINRRISTINALFANNALRSLSISLFGIFQPIYIYILTGSIEAVFIFTLVVKLTSLTASFEMGRIVARLGFRRSVLFSNLFLSLLLISLLFSSMSTWFLLPAAVFETPALLLYWFPHHILMIDDSDKGKLGGEVSFLNVISHIFHVLPPFVGGIVITLSGFNSLYLLSIIFAALSSVPLFFMPHHKKPKFLEYRRCFQSFSLPKLSFFSHGFEDYFIGVLWPIFMFLVLASYEKVGSLTSLMLFFSTVFLILIGYFLDKGRVAPIYRWAARLSFLLYPFRGLVSTFSGVLLIDSLHGVVRLSQKVPFEYLSYQKSTPGFEYEYVVFREVFLNLGRIAALISSYVLIRMQSPWVIVFTLPSIANLLILISSREFRTSR